MAHLPTNFMAFLKVLGEHVHDYLFSYMRLSHALCAPFTYYFSP